MQYFRNATSRRNLVVVRTATPVISSSLRNCSSSAASTEPQQQVFEDSSNNQRFLTFDKNTFVLSQIDYCAKLAGEANEKHGVPTNIPPQACPDTFDHKVVYCEILGKRALDPSAFAYPVQFEPPPKHIPGMETPKTERQLQQEAAAAAAVPNIVGKKKGGKDATKDVPVPASSAAATAKQKSNLLSEFPNPFKIQKYSEMHNIASSGMDGFSMNAWKEYAEKMKNNARQVDYPTDDEIDTLLLQVWDPVVSKRVPEFTKVNPNFVFRECKDYVVADANSDELKRSKLKISDAVLRGESAKVKQPGLSPEHQVHFVTPFTNISMDDGADGNSLSPPKLSKYADKNAFACGECALKFRTYDGLKQHYSKDHRGKSIPLVKDLEFRDASFRQQNNVNPQHQQMMMAMQQQQQQSSSSSSIGSGAGSVNQLRMKLEMLKQKKKKELEEKLLLKEKKLLEEEKQKQEEVDKKAATAEGEGEDETTSSTAATSDDADSNKTKKSPSSSSTLTGEDAIQATPLPEVDISLHSRTSSNIQILGLVRQIQTGYAGKDFVAELLVETEFDSENEEDKDVFTVRCFGEDFANSTANSIEEGVSKVLIRGVYKSNLHIDRASGKPQCFPFVKVNYPFGDVSVVA